MLYWRLGLGEGWHIMLLPCFGFCIMQTQRYPNKIWHSGFTLVSYWLFLFSRVHIGGFGPWKLFLEGSHSQACKWIVEEISCSSFWPVGSVWFFYLCSFRKYLCSFIYRSIYKHNHGKLVGMLYALTKALHCLMYVDYFNACFIICDGFTIVFCQHLNKISFESWFYFLINLECLLLLDGLAKAGSLLVDKVVTRLHNHCLKPSLYMS